MQAPARHLRTGKQAVTQYLLIVLAIVCGLGVALNLALTGWVLASARASWWARSRLSRRRRGRIAGAASRGRARVPNSAALGQEINHLLAELETAQTEISQLYGLAREQADQDPVTGLLSRARSSKVWSVAWRTPVSAPESWLC